MRRAATEREIERLARAVRDGLRFGLLAVRVASEWTPGLVRHPRHRRPFRGMEEWKFVLELLERRHPVERITLRNPPGGAGWVMKVAMPDSSTLYIKLELDDDGYALGRSFHTSRHAPHGNRPGRPDA